MEGQMLKATLNRGNTLWMTFHNYCVPTGKCPIKLGYIPRCFEIFTSLQTWRRIIGNGNKIWDCMVRSEFYCGCVVFSSSKTHEAYALIQKY